MINILEGWTNYLIAGGVLLALIALFIGTYLLNKKTPKPDGCKEHVECEGCKIVSCSHHPSNQEHAEPQEEVSVEESSTKVEEEIQKEEGEK